MLYSYTVSLHHQISLNHMTDGNVTLGHLPVLPHWMPLIEELHHPGSPLYDIFTCNSTTWLKKFWFHVQIVHSKYNWQCCFKINCQGHQLSWSLGTTCSVTDQMMSSHLVVMLWPRYTAFLTTVLVCAFLIDFNLFLRSNISYYPVFVF